MSLNPSTLTAENHAGHTAFLQIQGRMSQANDLLITSDILGGTPLIDAPTSWDYFNWKLEYSAQKVGTENKERLHIMNALNNAHNPNMRWLGNIPPDALIEMRSKGAIEEIREVLSSGVREIIALDSSNYAESAKKVHSNIQYAFDEHQRKLNKIIEKGWKYAKKDVGTFLVTGTISVASAVVFNSLPAVGALAGIAITQASTKTIPQMIKTGKKIKSEYRAETKTPVGLLFSNSEWKKC